MKRAFFVVVLPLAMLIALSTGCSSSGGSSAGDTNSSNPTVTIDSQPLTIDTAPEALAQRAAVIFIEMEHADSNTQDFEETLTVYVTSTQLSNCYARLYWLVNTSATKDALIETLQAALNSYSTVDLYGVAHGGMQYFWGHFDDRIYVDDILGMKDLDNIDHLRFVFLGTCHSWDTTDEFIDIGAVSTVGSAIVMNTYPFYAAFLYNFATLGYPLDKAVKLSQTPLWDDFRIRGDASLRLRSAK